MNDWRERFKASLYTIWERGYHSHSVGPWQDEWVDDFLEANALDLAAVRAGVESGTIEGRFVRLCEKHGTTKSPGLKNECYWGRDARLAGYDDYEDCKLVQHLVIPLSDGEEET